MEIGLPRELGGELYHAKVKSRAVNRYGIPVGVETSNPITDTRLYDVEYLDGTIKTLSVNVIADNLLSQVEEERQLQFMIDEIIYHHINTKALLREDSLCSTKNDNKCRKQKTKGWELCM